MVWMIGAGDLESSRSPVVTAQPVLTWNSVAYPRLPTPCRYSTEGRSTGLDEQLPLESSLWYLRRSRLPIPQPDLIATPPAVPQIVVADYGVNRAIIELEATVGLVGKGSEVGGADAEGFLCVDPGRFRHLRSFGEQ